MPPPPSAVMSSDAAAHAEDTLHLRDAWAALNAFFRDDPYFLTRHHIDSYDRFLDSGLAATVRNMTAISLLKKDDKGRTVSVEVRIGTRQISYDIPTVPGQGRPLLPNEARLRDLTYGVNVFADVVVDIRVDGNVVEVPPFDHPICLGQMPLMLHSRHCLLHGLSPEALREAGECPNDRGGYFVIDGREKVVLPQEEPVLNRPYVRRGESSSPDIAYKAFVRCDSPKDSFPRTATFYVRSADAVSRPNTISVVVTHLGTVASGPAARGPKEVKAIRDNVPLFALFRALGVESDRDILRHIVYDLDAPEEADVLEFLRPSANDAAMRGLTDQRSALAWMQTLVRGTSSLKQVLVDDLMPNMGRDFAAKALFLGHTVSRIARAALGKAPLSERDDYANKRLDLSGAKMGDLFRDVYLRLRSLCIMRLNNEWQSGAWRATGDVRNLVTPANLGVIFESGMLSERMRRSMKGDWGPDGDEGEGEGRDDASGVVQDLSRMSYMAYVSHVRRLNNPVDRSIKMSDPHLVRASQWGAMCPVESPDGPNVGLLNHLATLATVSLGSDPERARVAVLDSGLAIALSDLIGERVDLRVLRGACKVLLNDTWIAVAQDPPALVALLRSMRRAGRLQRDTSVAWGILERELHVHTDRGRFMRPLAIVTPAAGQDPASGAPRPSLPLPLRAAVASVEAEGRSLTWRADLLEAPVVGSLGPSVELVDVEELRTLMVAMRASDIGRVDARYTHCELHVGAAILSPSTNTFPMLHMNNAPRNVFGLGQFKQALGTYSTAFLSRMDTHGYVLHHPQRPLVGTTFADKLCRGQLAQAENLIVAVCTYTGYNMEDSVILNRDSVERGRFHVTAYATHRFEEEVGDEGPNVLFANPMQVEAETAGLVVKGVRRTPPGAYDTIGRDGLPLPDAHVREGAVLIGRVSKPEERRSVGIRLKREDDAATTLQQQRQDRSAVATKKTAGFIDRVFLYPSPLPGGKARWCKVRTRELRQPVLGDKIGSRYSQKGVVGMMMPAVDMPFSSASGITPDLLINPHGFPTRNTVAHLVECLLGKAGSLAGTRYNVDSLEQPQTDPLTAAAEVLAAHGMHAAGDEVLHNGRSGEQMHVNIFVGTNYYGRLKHMVQDKYQYRERGGAVNVVHRQPTKNAAGSGGLRVGEMEQNALLAHGTTSFLKESFVERSDGHRMVIDADEGVPAVVATEDGVMRALPGAGGAGGGPPRYADLQVPYAFKLLNQELQAMSLGLILHAEDEYGEDTTDGEEKDGRDSEGEGSSSGQQRGEGGEEAVDEDFDDGGEMDDGGDGGDGV